jgi:uncharacterized protein involved in exopolysaccharide biosynthesis
LNIFPTIKRRKLQHNIREKLHFSREKHSAEDKIELIDLLKVVWKWILLVVGGTLALCLLSTLYGFNALRQHDSTKHRLSQHI